MKNWHNQTELDYPLTLTEASEALYILSRDVANILYRIERIEQYLLNEIRKKETNNERN